MSQLVGEYALGALLGTGGASAVYAARHRRTGAAVAIKLLRADDAGAALAAALAEAAGPRAIDHTAVVRVLEDYDPRARYASRTLRVTWGGTDEGGARSVPDRRCIALGGFRPVSIRYSVAATPYTSDHGPCAPPPEYCSGGA